MDFWDKRFNQKEYVFGKKPAAASVTHEELLIPQGETFVVADGEDRLLFNCRRESKKISRRKKCKR